MNPDFLKYRSVTQPVLRFQIHCIPFTKCSIYEELPVLKQTVLKQTATGTVSMGPRKLWVYEEQGDIIAEGLPPFNDLARGHGHTVLEAIGDLCIWEGIVEIAEPCTVVDRRWSTANRQQPGGQ